jgi:hypothetical protein
LTGAFRWQLKKATAQRHEGGRRAAMTVQRDWSEKKNPLQTRKSHTRFFLSSLFAQEKTRSAGTVRPHWSVKNRIPTPSPPELSQK